MSKNGYILDGHTPVVCDDIVKWAEWFETAERTVASTYLGDVHISSVFLGLDHNYSHAGPPLLFETMIFGHQEYEGCQWRYATWEEAEWHHQLLVMALRTGGAMPGPVSAKESARQLRGKSYEAAMERIFLSDKPSE